MMRKNVVRYFAIGLLISPLVALGQFIYVNQGAPGRYGPWPVVITAPGSSDGGSVVFTTSAFCSSTGSDGGTPHQVTAVTTTPTACPPTQDPNLRYIVLCNSLENSGNPLVKIRIDGVGPALGNVDAGDVLGVGDCITYPIPGTVTPQCIASGASTGVTSFECR